MRDVFLWREMPDFEKLKPLPANDGYTLIRISKVIEVPPSAAP